MSRTALEEATRTRDYYARRARRMDALHLRGALLVGGCYLLAAAGLGLGAGIARFSTGTAVLYVLGIAIAGNFRFDVGAGFTVPTQAVFVPMLFALPPSLVPLLVPAGLLLGMTPQILRRELTPDWLLTALANSWFALGPALVLVLAHDHDPQGRWGILILALLAQFACDFLSSVVRERLYRGPSIRELLAEYRPVYAIDLALSALGLLVAFAAVAAHDQLAVLLIAPLFAMLRLFSRERHERLRQMAELGDAYQGTALMLGDVVEADDAYTGEHCKGVVALSLAVASELGLDPERTRNVEFGALLHDVGKLSVPNEIINKPGPLDAQEWEIVKRHTIEGQRMLERIGGFMSHIGLIVRASHERWDGSGYPDGLAGQEIPLEARIVAACDAFNAMTTNRSYREAMDPAAARAEMRHSAGSHFDPDVVRALLDVVAREQPLLSAAGELRSAPSAPPARPASHPASSAPRPAGVVASTR